VPEKGPDRSERPAVTIVSGLPRSGTSLMMQMLAAGGMTLLTDHARAADEDNPKGYFEYEAVKRTRDDPAWLEDADGRVVKMVHLLLYDLPPDRSYRVLLMKRDLSEVVRSQRVMLDRLGREGADLTGEQLSAAYEKQLAKLTQWLEERPQFAVLEVDYNDLLADPGPAIRHVNEFLGGALNEDGMRGVIDPTLYRQRGPSGAAAGGMGEPAV